MNINERIAQAEKGFKHGIVELLDLWPSLTEGQRSDVCGDLERMLSVIRIKNGAAKRDQKGDTAVLRK